MRIVIDIDEDDLNRIQRMPLGHTDYRTTLRLYESVKGCVLYKEHRTVAEIMDEVHSAMGQMIAR